MSLRIERMEMRDVDIVSVDVARLLSDLLQMRMTIAKLKLRMMEICGLRLKNRTRCCKLLGTTRNGRMIARFLKRKKKIPR